MADKLTSRCLVPSHDADVNLVFLIQFISVGQQIVLALMHVFSLSQSSHRFSHRVIYAVTTTVSGTN